MKFLQLIIIIILAIILFGCGFSDIKTQGLTRPSFPSQKQYVLEKYLFDFMPTFYVWSAKYTTFLDAKDLKDGTLFKVEKKNNFNQNVFLSTDLKKNKSYFLKEEQSKFAGDNKIHYAIYENENKFIETNQLLKGNYLKYELVFENEKYIFEGKTNNIGDKIISFKFTLKNNDAEYVHIFKEVYYFKDIHEIFINRKFGKFDDLTFITLAAFVDQITKENGYEYRQ
jgi:hypothetical protein